MDRQELDVVDELDLEEFEEEALDDADDWEDSLPEPDWDDDSTLMQDVVPGRRGGWDD